MPGKPLIQVTATLSYLSPPFLTAIAFVYLFSPNAGLINVLMRDVLGLPWLTFNIFSMTGPGAGHGAAHLPVRLSCWRRARCSRSTRPTRRRRRSSAPASCAPRCSITAPLVAPAILSGTLLAFVNAIALFGSQAIIGLPGRIVTLPTRIYALFDYPPEYGLASALSLVFVAHHRGRALSAARVPGAALLRHARRQGRAAAADASSAPLRWVLFGFVRAGLRRRDRRCPMRR